MEQIMTLSPEQKLLVQQSFATIAVNAPQVASTFYSRLFQLEPSARELFKHDLNSQGMKLMQMIGTAVGSLDNLDALTPAIQDLGRRHVGYGVKQEQYAIVGSALLWTLEQTLGEQFTPEVLDAWSAVYQFLAQTAIEAAYMHQ